MCLLNLAASGLQNEGMRDGLERKQVACAVAAQIRWLVSPPAGVLPPFTSCMQAKPMPQKPLHPREAHKAGIKRAAPTPPSSAALQPSSGSILCPSGRSSWRKNSSQSRRWSQRTVPTPTPLARTGQPAGSAPATRVGAAWGLVGRLCGSCVLEGALHAMASLSGSPAHTPAAGAGRRQASSRPAWMPQLPCLQQ